jgi:acyl carrier protein
VLTIFDRIKKLLIEVSEVEEKIVTLEARFKEDLNLDSLGQLELIMAMEEEFAFEIEDHDVKQLTSVNEAVDFITNKIEKVS